MKPGLGETKDTAFAVKFYPGALLFRESRPFDKLRMRPVFRRKRG
jgi:hypothetical protein